MIEYYKILSLEDCEGELWKAVKGYEGIYEVSNYGRVKSISRIALKRSGGIKRTTKPFILKSVLEAGYKYVRITKNYKRKKLKTARIVAFAWIDNPDNKPQVNHKNGIRYNDTVENLEWVTAKENSIHAVETGLSPIIGGQHWKSLLTNDEAVDIATSELSRKELMDKYQIGYHIVERIQKGTSWSRITGIKYKKKYLPDCDILYIYNSNESNRVLAKKFNISVGTVSKIKTGKQRASVTGHIYKRALLSEKDVLEIFNSSLSAKVLSEKYNISTANIYYIRSGKSWSHITKNKVAI